jgi:hypothetical protein
MAYTTIDDPSKYFDVTLWTGDGGARTITGLNHKPDLIWTKTRSVGYNHMWSDSSRGFNANSELGSNSTAAEGGLSAETYGYKSGHTSDGWTMVDGTDTVDSQEDGNTNQPSVTYVGWTWAANGGTTTTNDASATSVGDTDSVYQVNSTAKFSIVTWTGSGSGTVSIAHGLGSTPKFLIIKQRDGANSWLVYHHKNTAVDEAHDTFLKLHLTNASSADDNNYFMNNTAPTSTVATFGTGNEANQSGTYVGYFFDEIQGYSKFGTYTGNANDDGPFLYTGFKPKFAIFKATSAAGEGWAIRDSARDPFNQMSGKLSANVSATEGTTADDNDCDFLSNGIKLRSNDNQMNKTGVTFIYIAFAEHPFVSSKGVPVTAR